MRILEKPVSMTVFMGFYFSKSYLYGISVFQRTRSCHRRWRSQGFGDMSPTSVFVDLPETANLRKYATLYKVALLAGIVFFEQKKYNNNIGGTVWTI